MMKLLISLLIMLNVGGDISKEVTKEGFIFNIKTEKEIYKPCELIYVDIELTNSTEKTKVIGKSLDEQDYNLIITDDKDKQVCLTQYAKNKQNKLRMGSVILEKILPNKSINARILVNRIYDMTMSGEYLIKVERRVEKLEKSEGNYYADIESNTIKIKIAD